MLVVVVVVLVLVLVVAAAALVMHSTALVRGAAREVGAGSRGRALVCPQAAAVVARCGVAPQS